VNVKEYIKSGVIESYVLGIATEPERLEFEQMCAAYAEIAEARDAFERSLEAELMQGAEEPPAFVREKVFLQVRPATAEHGGGYEEQLEETPVRRLNLWKWVAAASLILLAGAGYWAYTTNEKYNDLVGRQSSMEQQLKESTARLQTMEQDAEMMRKPGMKMVALKGTKDAPGAKTTIFWDTTGADKAVYMLINNLPTPPTEKQYQLWALFDGKPIDLGVFDFAVREQRLLVKMKNVQNAQAFAITLEEKGGKPAPEGPIYVVGNL
jgi:anti-sigma-K factor RskA